MFHEIELRKNVLFVAGLILNSKNASIYRHSVSILCLSLSLCPARREFNSGKAMRNIKELADGFSISFYKIIAFSHLISITESIDKHYFKIRLLVL